MCQLLFLLRCAKGTLMSHFLDLEPFPGMRYNEIRKAYIFIILSFNNKEDSNGKGIYKNG